MTKLILAIALLLATAAQADTTNIDMSGTSPAGASTTTVGYTTKTELGQFTSCSGYARLTGGTGGTLDIFIQTAYRTVAVSPVWGDVMHFPQLSAGATVAAFAFTLTRFSPTAAAITSGLNVTDGTPALAVNTIVPGMLGYLFRVVYKTGAGNTVGAAQVITIQCSST
jgi:hypothetical protein